MKVQIRQGVFETNSSSVHSMTMCLESEYQAWLEGKMKYRKDASDKEQFLSNEEADAWNMEEMDLREGETFEEAWKELIADKYDVGGFYLTAEEFEEITEDDYYETFEQVFETPSGEKVRAFGYHGYDGG